MNARSESDREVVVSASRLDAEWVEEVGSK